MRRLLYNLGIFFLPLMLIWIITTPLFNFLFDPYGLLSKHHHDYNTEPNMRSLKREFVSSTENNYPLLLFSNSRGGVYQIEDRGFYNMSYSMGLPEEFLADIKYLLKKKSRIDSVILFLDDTSIYNDYRSHFNQPLRRVYQLDDYYSILTIPFSYGKFKGSLYKRNKHAQFFLDSDGHYEYYGFDHVSNKIDTMDVEILTDNAHDIDRAVTAWLDLTNLLKSKGIGFGLFIHPLAKTNVESRPYILNDLNRLVFSLRQNGLIFQNEVVVLESDSACFYDGSHYSPEVADYVLGKKNPTNISGVRSFFWGVN